jgi:hypothetical protein
MKFLFGDVDIKSETDQWVRKVKSNVRKIKINPLDE